jgi:hypothetical protein
MLKRQRLLSDPEAGDFAGAPASGRWGKEETLGFLRHRLSCSVSAALCVDADLATRERCCLPWYGLYLRSFAVIGGEKVGHREVEESPRTATSGLVERMMASGFKAVDGGYLFQPMSGWRLGRSPCYLVNEEQKAMIAGRITKNMKAMPSFWAAYFVAWVAVTTILLVAQWEVSQVFMTAIVGTTTVFVIAAQVYARRTIGPLLAGLPVATDRISLNDRLKLQSKVFSSKFFLLIALADILLGVIAVAGWAYAQGGFELPVIAIVLFAGAAWYLWLVFLRWKAARP